MELQPNSQMYFCQGLILSPEIIQYFDLCKENRICSYVHLAQ